MKGHTYYVGRNLYMVELKIPKSEFMPVAMIKSKIEWIIEITKTEDPNYYFDDDGAMDMVLEMIEADDRMVFYSFICDRTTYRKLLKFQKLLNYQVNRGP